MLHMHRMSKELGPDDGIWPPDNTEDRNSDSLYYSSLRARSAATKAHAQSNWPKYVKLITVGGVLMALSRIYWEANLK